MFKLYEIDDNYVTYMHSKDDKVMLPLGPNYTHSRKYIGIVLQINGVKYFAPLSSPKNNDYVFADGNRVPRKSAFTIFRLIDKSVVLGKILLNSMIPVPDCYVTEYDVDNEPDLQYQSLVQKEVNLIKHLEKDILKNAKILYIKKSKGETGGYLDATVDFKKLENAMLNYKKP